MAAVMPSSLPAAPAPSAVLPYGNWTPALFIPYVRSIGGIHAQVTIEEQHTDALQITDHPVEASAPVSDHAFAIPQQVTISAGWSRAVAYDLSAESGVYGLLLSWQNSLMPFDVITGKRHYTNMLIERLIVTTDQHSEFELMAHISCRQVIIAQVTTAQVAGTMSSNPNAQANPASNAPSTDNGEQAPANLGSGDLLTTDTSTVGDVVAGPQGDAPSPLTPDTTTVGDQVTANAVENTVGQNTTPQDLSEKGLAAQPDGTSVDFEKLPFMAQAGMPRPRGIDWQRTSRYRPRPGSRFRRA